MAEPGNFTSRAQCRERSRFPWTGMLLKDVTLGHTDVSASQLVTVKEKVGDMFLVIWERVTPPASGRVPSGFVDEAVGATIEARLLGKHQITWGANANWAARATATQKFELPYPYRLEKDSTVRIRKEDFDPNKSYWPVNFQGEEYMVPQRKVLLDMEEDNSPKPPVQLGEGKLAYEATIIEEHVVLSTLIVDANAPVVVEQSKSGNWRYLGHGLDTEISADLVKVETGLPSPDSSVKLLCYELGPYAAALCGLLADFVRDAIAGKADRDTGEYWLRKLTVGQPATLELLPGQLIEHYPIAGKFQRGDFVAFYDTQQRCNHIAVATGDNQNVYSLWNTPVDYPVNVPAGLLYKATNPPTQYITITTPRWHR